MIRKFNFTGRKRIPRSRIAVSILPAERGPASFEASFDLSGMKLPDHARIFMEAYRGGNFMRFPFGTVGRPEPCPDRILQDFEPKSLILFRVKVVDPKAKGRILAGADRIIPRGAKDETGNRVSLLPVDFVDLGNLVWRLDLAGDWPSLQLNLRAGNIREIARSDRFFLSLIYPEILRQILHRIVIEEDHTDPETDPEDWMSQWLIFTGRMFGENYLPPSGRSEPVVQEKYKWIEEAVEVFCVNHQTLESFIQACNGEEKL